MTFWTIGFPQNVLTFLFTFWHYKTPQKFMTEIYTEKSLIQIWILSVTNTSKIFGFLMNSCIQLPYPQGSSYLILVAIRSGPRFVLIGFWPTLVYRLIILRGSHYFCGDPDQDQNFGSWSIFLSGHNLKHVLTLQQIKRLQWVTCFRSRFWSWYQ